MLTSFAGRDVSSSECVIGPKGRETGLTGSAGRTPVSSHTGSYAMATAEHREPCESRGSCTVLGAPGGEIPPGDSPSRGMPIASSARQKSLRKLPESLQRGSLLPCAIALNRCRDSCCAGCPIEVGQKALWRHMEHSAEGHGEGQASNKLAPQAGNRNDV